MPASNTLQFDFFDMSMAGANITSYSDYLQIFRMHNNKIPGSDLEDILEDYNTFLGTYPPRNNLTMDFSGPLNGYIEDTVTNADYQALDDKFLSEALTLTFDCNISPGALSNGAVVFTFDDGLKNHLEVIEPILYEYGIDGTSYITIDFVDNETLYSDSGMTWTEIGILQDSGWVIGSHGWTHVNYSTLNSTQLGQQMYGIDTGFTNNGFTFPEHFAYPFGGYSALSTDTVSDRFLSARIVDSYYVGTGSDKYVFPGIELENQASSNTQYYKDYIDFADNNNVAVIFLSHAVYGNCDTIDHDNCLDIGLLRDVIEYSQAKGVDILTIDELYDLLD
jgi:peptidoglycan/xylan/chitin deacetylase (PgdA/CDA1 family)